MNMLSNEKINFKSLEEKTFKEMMKLGRKIIQDELRMLDRLILDYRDKEIFEPKDFQETTTKIISYRKSKFADVIETEKALEPNPFGGCAGDAKVLLSQYISISDY